MGRFVLFRDGVEVVEEAVEKIGAGSCRADFLVFGGTAFGLCRMLGIVLPGEQSAAEGE